MNELNNEVLNEEVMEVTPVEYEVVELVEEVEETDNGSNPLLIAAAVTAAVVGVGFGVKKFKQWRANKKIKEDADKVYETVMEVKDLEEVQTEITEETK